MISEDKIIEIFCFANDFSKLFDKLTNCINEQSLKTFTNRHSHAAQNNQFYRI